MATFTLPTYVWRTPDEWGIETFCGSWDELCTIAADLRSVGIEADPNDGPVQYMLVGAVDRGLPRGWYTRATYEMADGRTMWGLHCVELNANLKPRRQCYRQKPQVYSDVDDAEREMLVRCLADAQPC
jgi:hypothetical protein